MTSNLIAACPTPSVSAEHAQCVITHGRSASGAAVTCPALRELPLGVQKDMTVMPMSAYQQDIALAQGETVLLERFALHDIARFNALVTVKQANAFVLLALNAERVSASQVQKFDSQCLSTFQL